MELFKLFGILAINNTEANKAIDETTDKSKDAGESFNEMASESEKSESRMSKVFGKIGNFAAAAGKAIATCLAVGAVAFSGLTIKALNMSGELEQNMGGSEAVFKEYAESMQDTAKSAFSDMGLSASDFLATANKMGALFQGAGFDIQESADLSSKAMQRAADVASIMGIDTSAAMESIAGAAKGNFTMMDNLGVAMNDTTLQAYAMEKGITKSTQSMTNQEKISLAMEMFLEKTTYAAGNYAKENETLAGSLSTAKAALSNFLDGSGDVDSLVDSFTNAADVIVENLDSLLPRLTNGLTNLINKLIPKIPPLLNKLLPGVVEGAVTLLQGLVTALPALLDVLMTVLPELIDGFIQIAISLTAALVNALPMVLPALIDGIIQLVVGIAQALPQMINLLIDKLPEILISVVNAIVENLPILIDGAIALTLGIVQAIPKIIMALINALPQIIESIVTGLILALPQLIEGCILLVIELVKALPQITLALIKAIPNIMLGIIAALWNVAQMLWDAFSGIFTKAWDAIKLIFSGTKIGNFFKGVWESIVGIFKGVGTFFSDIFKGAVNGIQNAFSGIKQFFKNIFEAVANIVKAPINFIIKGINGFIDTLNKIKIPDWVPGVGGKGISLPNIPMLAKGGVLEKGQTGLLEGSGAEAVVPLEQNTGWIYKVAEQLHVIQADNFITAKNNETKTDVPDIHLHMHIQTFNNNTDSDLDDLMARMADYIKRKGVVYT